MARGSLRSCLFGRGKGHRLIVVAFFFGWGGEPVAGDADAR